MRHGAVGALALSLGLAQLAYAGNSTPAAVTGEQALAEAKHNQQLAGDLWIANAQACQGRDLPGLYAVMRRVNSELKAQPTNHQMYSARFAYSGCQQMLLDVSFLNGSCLSNVPDQHTLEHAKTSWSKSSAQCAAEIASPQSADAGYSDEEVNQVMRKAANNI